MRAPRTRRRHASRLTSQRMLVRLLTVTVLGLPPTLQAQQKGADSTRAHDMAGMSTGDPLMRMVPMEGQLGMRMGLEGARPSTSPFLPGHDVDPASIPMAVPGTLVRLADGDTLDLEAGLVRRSLRGHSVVMYGFNRQYPGPLIRVAQNATIVVRLVNHLEFPTTIHWHGLRQDYHNDGTPGVSQAPVPPGGSFVYHVHFPDAGIYWYHPHVREDIEQNLGLYGNEIVDSPNPTYYSPVNREETLILSDLLMDDDGIFPYGKEAPDFAIMGRFGNVFLANGEPDYHLEVRRGDVVRFFITNAASSRTFNLDFGGLPLKVVASDLSKFDHEVLATSVPITVAERYVVEVRFDRTGDFLLTNRVQAVNQVRGEFYPEVDTLGTITVSPQATRHDYGSEFATLRTNQDVRDDIARFRTYFSRPVDKHLELTVNMQGLPGLMAAFLVQDTLYYPPVEWNDGMPHMNWLATAREARWILRDPDTGRENDDIDWHFKQGAVVKIRIHNDERSIHPMNHPIHFHGQRFLVLARGGVPNQNLVWKDTVLVPVGGTVDILLDASNPGRWMAHCHIAEHLGSGMAMVFTVDPAVGAAAGT